MAQPDPYQRSRHESQAYQVSTFGKPQETAKSGYGRRLKGSPVYAIPLRIEDSGDTAAQTIGDLTAGVWVKGVVVNTVSTGTAPTAEIALAETAPGEGDGVVLEAALDLLTLGETDLTTQLEPLAQDRVLTVTITDGVADEPLMLTLLVVPITESWF